MRGRQTGCVSGSRAASQERWRTVPSPISLRAKQREWDSSRLMENFLLERCSHRANMETEMGLFVLIQLNIKFEKLEDRHKAEV